MKQYKTLKTTAAIALGVSALATTVAPGTVSAAQYKLNAKKQLVKTSTGKVAKGNVVYKGKLYKNGKLAKAKKYTLVGSGSNLQLFYGSTLKKGSKTASNKTYLFKDGKLAKGIIQAGAGERLYENGKLSKGYDVVTDKNGEKSLYQNGYLKKGLKTAKRDGVTQLYKDGKLADGAVVFKNVLYTAGSVSKGLVEHEGTFYNNGKLANGELDGAEFTNGVVTATKEVVALKKETAKTAEAQKALTDAVATKDEAKIEAAAQALVAQAAAQATAAQAVAEKATTTAGVESAQAAIKAATQSGEAAVEAAKAAGKTVDAKVLDAAVEAATKAVDANTNKPVTPEEPKPTEPTDPTPTDPETPSTGGNTGGNTGGTDGGTTTPAITAKEVNVVGKDGVTAVTELAVGDVLTANLKLTDGTLIGSYPVNADVTYNWHYEGSEDSLGKEATFTITSDTVDAAKKVAVDVTYKGKTVTWTSENAALDKVLPVITLGTDTATKEITYKNLQNAAPTATATDNVGTPVVTATYTLENQTYETFEAAAKVANVGDKLVVEFKAVDASGNVAKESVTYTVTGLTAPQSSLTETTVEGLTEATATFFAKGLNKDTSKEVAVSLDEVKTYLATTYDVNLNKDVITITDGKLAIDSTQKAFTTAEWNKIKTAGDATIPYRISLNVAGKLVKVAFYEDGTAVIEDNRELVATQALVEALATNPKTNQKAINEAQAKVNALSANKVRQELQAKIDAAQTKLDTAVLSAPENGLKSVEVEGLTTANAKFNVKNLFADGGSKEIDASLEEVKQFINQQYGVNFDSSKIQVIDNKLTITGSVLSTADWSKIKTNGDPTTSYRITLANTDAKVKIAFYKDGTAVIEDNRVATKFEAQTEAISTRVGLEVTGEQIAQGIKNLPEGATVKAENFTAKADQQGTTVNQDATVKFADGSKKIVQVPMQVATMLTVTGQVTKIVSLVNPTEKLLVKFIKNDAGDQVATSLEDIATKFAEKGIKFDASKIKFINEELIVENDAILTAEWNKIKSTPGSDLNSPYRMTVDGTNKKLKIAFYEDGTTTIEDNRVAATMQALATFQ